MIEKIYKTANGDIHYWVSDTIDNQRVTLFFLPGLQYIEGKWNSNINQF